MDRLFGTDGIRGNAGSFPLDDPTIRVIGRSVALQMRERLGRQPRILTGRDTRESGEWIEKAFHSGAAEAECESAGVFTTPGIAYLTRAFDFDAGVVISASHNPYRDNGIKIFLPSGKKLDESSERQIEEDIRSSLAVKAADAEVSTGRMAEFRDSYIRHLEGEVNGLRLDGMKIVIDCANGAASEIAPELLKDLGASLTSINDRPDGRNINENCGSLHLDGLRERVTAEGADLGVAFDGDADRALFVDEKGNLIDGDATLWIMARYLQNHGKLPQKRVVATVMSNIGLEIALASQGIELSRTSVGDKYVLEELLRTKLPLGGEQSGHIIFPEESLVGDGILTALFLLNALRERNVTLSEAVKGFTRYPQTLINVPVRQKQPFEDVQKIAATAREIEDELNGNGRLLLRYSGTENLARVMIEGKDQASINEQANRLAETIRSELS